MKVKLDEGAFAPEKAHKTDAGFDIRSKEHRIVYARDSAIFATGVHIELPKGTCGILISKSGLYTRHGITSTGLIDEGYTGEILVKLMNHEIKPYEVHKGDKISQLVIVPIINTDVEIVEELSESERGNNGFGSTGR